MRGMLWLREDLRVNDNSALYHAAENCSDGLLAVYIIDVAMWKKHGLAAARINFHLTGLQELAKDLSKLNISLLCLSVEDSAAIPAVLLQICQSHQLQALFYNRQYEVNEQRRDQAVERHLKQHGIVSYSYDDQCILSPKTVLTQSGEYFKVFTPFKRSWLQCMTEKSVPGLLPKIKARRNLTLASSDIPSLITSFNADIDSLLWPAGEQEAQLRLQKFIDKSITSYDKWRDFPGHDGTSKLSPYLTAGMISPRQCLHAALEKNNQEFTAGNQGVATWISELIWRDFYKHILFACPRVSMNLPYKLSTEKLKWRHDPELLLAWQEGKTGYPLIDAAMRQLRQTGWMHNRLRMVVAMFFTKNLFLDWRLGESYFMSQLIDGDLAANNGGWQWCASTGVDAVPYFRVFNPVRQSERFDPQGMFIRQFCPELNRLDNKTIHDPSHRGANLVKLNYPAAVVDLEKTRKFAIEAYKKLG